jgi:hypothetical protein
MSKADVERAISKINGAKALGDREAMEAVRDVLSQFFFAPLREAPFSLKLSGPLKPNYIGEVHHEPSTSAELLKRVANDPERLRTISNVLKESAPWFTAPLYIGMADDLGERLARHKALITRFRENASSISGGAEGASFAKQVVERGIEPEKLFVQVLEVSTATRENSDIENLLNRINFPILGRN